VTSLKFNVEGEQGLEVDERDREGAGELIKTRSEDVPAAAPDLRAAEGRVFSAAIASVLSTERTRPGHPISSTPLDKTSSTAATSEPGETPDEACGVSSGGCRRAPRENRADRSV